LIDASDRDSSQDKNGKIGDIGDDETLSSKITSGLLFVDEIVQ
jgi:hypothetical protein